MQQIFDDVDQSTSRTSQSSERYATFRALCLTSKLFRTFAQPILLKRVHVGVPGYNPLFSDLSRVNLLVDNNSTVSLALIRGL